MKTKDFLCRAAEEQEPGAQPPPPAAPEARFSTTRACRAQLAPRAVRIHPCAFQCSHGKGGSEEEVGLGSHIVSTSQQTPTWSQRTENEAAAASSAERGADCPAVCGCGGGCPSSGQEPPGALFTSVQLSGPPNAAQLLKAKMSSKQCEPNCPPTSASSIPSNKMSTGNKIE